MGDSRIVISVIVGILILVIGFNQEAFAATIESNGTGGGQWHLGTTWSGGVAPTLNDNVVIKSGDIVTISIVVSVNGSVTIEPGGKLILTSPIGHFNTKGQVTNNGEISIEGIGGIDGFWRVLENTVTNNGIITLKGGPGGFSSSLSIGVSGAMVNNGSIIMIGGNGFASAILNNSGILTNFGIITVSGGNGNFSGFLRNFAILTNECSGTITLDEDAFMENFGQFNNFGIFILDGTLFGSDPIDRTDECVLQVEIDIKPGSDPNAIQPLQMGVTAVVILSSSTFSAETVDFSTVTLGPDEATPVHKKPHFEDVNNDGLIDMVVHFKTKEIGIEQDTVELCLMAKTLDGTSIEGCDSIMVVPKV